MLNCAIVLAAPVNRSILQRWKRALHVPLRLDVYYQHGDSRRELLERWCLEYAPKTATHHPRQGFAQSSDPIVQLRQVCKQIVIWLRSLYCWSRMLPAQALRSQNTQNDAIGFSIYVVSEGNDDVSGLVSQQGFSSQGQPHSVWTPYGELGWKVFYAPNSVVQRLIPEVPPYSSVTNSNGNRTSSQPIPMRPQQHQMQGAQHSQAQSFHPQPGRELVRRDSTPATTTAQSAPHNSGRMYHRSKSDVSDTAHPNMSVTGGGLYAHQPLSQYPSQFAPNNSPTSRTMDASHPPIKNLSGLSLAMMTLSDDGDPEETPNSPATAAASKEAAEKRRAALHHAPPLLPQSSPSVNKKSPLASAGEYGYAYNNHIPQIRQTNNNNNNNTLPNVPNYPSPSPVPSTPLGSTPPGYLLGGPTPPPTGNWSKLIPPRGAVTPPFTRPMGFVDEPPSQPLPPPAAMSGASHTGHHRPSSRHESMAPTTSLDLLHSSPFRQPVYGSNFGSSMAAAAEPFGSMGSGFGGGGADLAFSSSPGRSGMIHPRLQQEDPDDMPFAVDSTNDGAGGVETTPSALASSSSSMIMRGMIQPPKRLQLFESLSASHQQQQQQQSTAVDDGMNSLADQLAEFKNFGASLMVAGPSQGSVTAGSSDVDPSASTSTPISLRT